MQRAASYQKAEADHSRTYALIGSLLLLGLSYVLLLAAPIVSRQLRTFAAGHAGLGAIESWLPAACVSGLVLGGGAALMFVLVQIAREAERRPYVCLAPVLAAFSACVLIGLRAELPLPGVSTEHVAVFALAVSVAGGALVQDARFSAQVIGVLLTLLPPASLLGVLWANSGKEDPAVALWTLNAQARAFVTMLTVTSFGIAVIAVVGRRGARSFADASLSGSEYLFDANWSADESALRKRGMPGWLLTMLSAAAVGLVFVGFKVALEARTTTSTVLETSPAQGALGALKQLVGGGAPALSGEAAKPALTAPQAVLEGTPTQAAPVAAAPEQPMPQVTAAQPAEAPNDARGSAPGQGKPAVELTKAAAKPAAELPKPASAPNAKAQLAARASAPAKARAVAVAHPLQKAKAHARMVKPAAVAKSAPVKEAVAPIAKAADVAPAKQPPAKTEPVAALAAKSAPHKPERASEPAPQQPAQTQAAARPSAPEAAPAKAKPTRGDESLDELMDNIVPGKGKHTAIGSKDDPIFGL